MAPLSDFVVTERFPELPTMEWEEWMTTQGHGWTTYELTGNKVLKLKLPKPKDVRVVLNDDLINAGWTLEWET